ncbi:cadherin-AgCad1-like isoform X3 [Cotesia typhae]|uniref:cadherin-AgCad1-like isoform X3 n=1 Tax=Cotesia typhae TaxID=2053667 RepID=UPI003D699C26
MKNFKCCIFFYFTCFVRMCECAWNVPPFGEPDNLNTAVHFKDYNEVAKRINIDLDEEVSNVSIVKLINYDTDESEPLITTFDKGSNYLLGAELKYQNGQWEVYITKKQDYEVQTMRNYVFWISKGSDSYSIGLYIDNIDDNAPIIQPPERSCAIKENYEGRSNCTYQVSDADGWVDQVVITLTSSVKEDIKRFYILSEKINEYEVKVYLGINKPLDFETISMYMLYINATDNSNITGTLTTILEVIDMPDESPKWARLTASETLKEKSTHTFIVTAVDGDIQINAEINYKIQVLNKDEEDYFNVDISTGVVTINPIDRDTLKKDVFRFVIIAFEKKDISSIANATIVVIIEDINDHEPEILPEMLSITIKEGKYTTLEFEQPVMITDPDLAENAQYSVHLTDDSDYNWHSAFLIVPNTGYQNTYFTISVSDALLLDYEDENWRNIKIEIQATEVGNQSHVGRRIVSIDLENLNDEFPIFENNSLTVSISEDVGNNYYICTILATDRDVNDTVKHSILGQKGFKINESTGVITTALDDSIHLDYESMSVIILQVIAIDLANHTTYATLIINVIDVNDVPPKLYLPTSKASLLEELPINSSIDYKIQTTDPDSDAKLIFSIDWDSTTALKNSVEVDTSYYSRHLNIVTNYPKKQTGYAEGYVSISRRIDYEALDVIFLTVVVTDLNTVHNANSTLALLTIYIIDINDNTPIFNNIEPMSVSENQLYDTVIGAITAVDADGPLFNRIFYSIEPVNNTEHDLIRINNKTGVIRVGKDKAIDAENYEYLHYNISASDGDNVNTTKIYIYVIDMNDEEPYLLNNQLSSIIHIPEKSPNRMKIVTLIAKDDDRTYPYNNVSYLVNTNHSDSLQYFKLGKFDGLLQINLADNYILDRDFGSAIHTLNIKLRDNYLIEGITWNTNSIDVIITVILDDVNDQVPKLPDLENPIAKISEITKENTSIIIITAEDYDDPDTNNTKVMYKILNNSLITTDYQYPESCKNPFKLITENLKEARILTDRNLSRCYGTWAVTIYAQDLGTNPGPLNDMKTYYLQVTDYNHNVPVIKFPIAGKKIALSENQTINSRLKTYDKQQLDDFTASDEDNGSSGTVVFSISGNNDDYKFFKIISTQKNSARLQLQNLPNITVQNLYQIIITATDEGDPPKTVSQELDIIFVATLGPKFVRNDWTVWIEENTLILNEDIILPEVHDNIGNDENIVRIYCFIDDRVGDHEFFKLDKDTRNLTIRKTLDRETQDIMSILIIATANSEGPPRVPRKEATLNITIIVVDKNDNAPSFEVDFYSGGIATSDPVDKTILIIKATDADLNETLIYKLIDNSIVVSDSSLTGIDNPFLLDSQSGKLLLKFIPRNSMTGFFTSIVAAYDAVKQNDTALIQIYIIAEENRVVFTFQNCAAYVIEKRIFIIKSFSKQFGYTCNIDEIKSGTDFSNQAFDNRTTLTSHFIDPSNNLPIDASTIVSASSDLQTVTNLKSILLTESLYLIDVPTKSLSTVDTIQEQIYWVLISLTIFFCLCSIAIFVIYLIRTRSLTKRINNIASEWKVDTQKKSSDYIRSVPMTNQFALTGSNPIWKVSTKESVRNSNDNISQTSGDSDFVGIGDNPDFGYNDDIMITNQNIDVTNQIYAHFSKVPKLILNDSYLEDKYSENDKSC